MSRRYLTHKEVESAINRGKQVEAFLGSFQKEEDCIRWLSVSGSGQQYSVSVWEAIDKGSEYYLDVYSFPPANGEWDEPVKVFEVSSLNEIAEVLGIGNLNFVNYGVVQDEYGDYKATCT